MGQKSATLALLVTSLLSPSAFSYSSEYCQQISERAVKNKINVMVIGVEGFSQINDTATQNLVRYSESAKAKQKFSVPKYSPLGIIGEAGVTRGLLSPLMRTHGTKVEPLIVSEGTIRRGSSSVAQKCAEIWMKVPGRKLIIAGHSFGGPAAMDLAKNLATKKIRVDALYSIDSVERPFTFPMSGSANIGYVANYRQLGFNSGKELSYAQHDEVLSSVGHMSIPGHPTILADLRERINSLSGSEKKRQRSTKTSNRNQTKDFEARTANAGARGKQ